MEDAAVDELDSAGAFGDVGSTEVDEDGGARSAVFAVARDPGIAEAAIDVADAHAVGRFVEDLGSFLAGVFRGAVDEFDEPLGSIVSDGTDAESGPAFLSDVREVIRFEAGFAHAGEAVFEADGDGMAVFGEWFQIDESGVSGVAFEDAVANDAVDEAFVGAVGFEVDAGFGRGAVGVGEEAIFDEDVLTTGDAESLTVVVVGDAVSEGDAFGPAVFAR